MGLIYTDSFKQSTAFSNLPDLNALFCQKKLDEICQIFAGGLIME